MHTMATMKTGWGALWSSWWPGKGASFGSPWWDIPRRYRLVQKECARHRERTSQRSKLQCALGRQVLWRRVWSGPLWSNAPTTPLPLASASRSPLAAPHPINPIFQPLPLPAIRTSRKRVVAQNHPNKLLLTRRVEQGKRLSFRRKNKKPARIRHPKSCFRPTISPSAITATA